MLWIGMVHEDFQVEEQECKEDPGRSKEGATAWGGQLYLGQ